MRWAGHVASVGEMNNAYDKILVRKPDWKDPLREYEFFHFSEEAQGV
jgi:hypothetical protein